MIRRAQATATVLFLCLLSLLASGAAGGQATVRTAEESRRQPTLLNWPSRGDRRDFELLVKSVDEPVVRVRPVGRHPYTSHSVVVVPLPNAIPQDLTPDDAPQYRLGFAIGYMEERNGKFACDAWHSEYSDAWKAGWADGFKQAQSASPRQPH